VTEPWLPPPPAPPPPVGPVTANPPRVLLWQKVYCVAMAVVYLLCAALGLAFMLFRESLADAKTTATEHLFVGALLLAVALPLTAAYAAGPFLPRRPWAWVYHIVLIGLSMTSCACLPIALPLLVFWIGPRVQAWYGRATALAALPAVPAPPGAWA